MEVFENALQTRFLKTKLCCIFVDANFFQIWKKILRFRKYPDTCGQGLSLNELRAKKGDKLDELINILTMAEERSGATRNPRQNSQLNHDQLCFQNPRFTAKIHNQYPF